MISKTVDFYESEIKELHSKLNDYPELKDKLSRTLSTWAEKVDITVYVASNEQYPWKIDEIGYKTNPMPTKKECGFDQVGDYQAQFKGGSLDCWCNSLVERKGGRQGKKGADDLYHTLMDRDERDRFYREHTRFMDDPRYKNGKMYVFAECTLDDFFNYSPPFHGKQRNLNHTGASVESRYGTVASLYERGIPIIWCGSRSRATKLYQRMLKQNLVKNYALYLGLT